MTHPSPNLIVLANAVAAAVLPAPTIVADYLGNQKPAILEVTRAGADGTVAVYGAKIPNPGAPLVAGKSWQGLGVTDQVNFTTDLVYAAFSNNNFVVLKNGVPVLYDGAGSPASGTFKLADVAGACRVVFATAPQAGDRITVFRVQVETILADAANQLLTKEITTRPLMWAVATGGTVSATRVTVTPKKPS